ncbi:hypothetical protein, partial [Microcoleus sp. herbarium12]|uniref:hypothetical protein n=1 Tax=Microcoleus sp. herbarium12 TaxID=3055437 RepID=UPI003B04B518
WMRTEVRTIKPFLGLVVRTLVLLLDVDKSPDYKQDYFTAINAVSSVQDFWNDVTMFFVVARKSIIGL